VHVEFAGWNNHDAAFLDDLFVLTRKSDESAPADEVEELLRLVNVGFRPRTGPEVNGKHFDACKSCLSSKVLDAHLADEVLWVIRLEFVCLVHPQEIITDLVNAQDVDRSLRDANPIVEAGTSK
jgi:hypothetical protein